MDKPVYPFMQVVVTIQGVVITTHLTPVSIFTQIIDIGTLEQIFPDIQQALARNRDIQNAVMQTVRGGR